MTVPELLTLLSATSGHTLLPGRVNCRQFAFNANYFLPSLEIAALSVVINLLWEMSLIMDPG